MTDAQPEPIRALVIEPGENQAVLQYLSRRPGATSLLETLSELVGGWIEVIGLTEDSVMYLNEEGKIEGLPVNRTANRLHALGTYRLMPGDVLVGPVVVLGVRDPDGEQDGEDHDVPPSVLDLCARAGIAIHDRTGDPA